MIFSPELLHEIIYDMKYFFMTNQPNSDWIGPKFLALQKFLDGQI